MPTRRVVSFLLFLSLSVLATGPALADQCWMIGKEEAAKALPYLQKGTEILHLCEPCGDDEKPRVEKVEKAEIVQPGENEEEITVVVNGEEIDAAYVFVPGEGKDKDKTWRNLAKLIGCPTEGVSETIERPSASSGGDLG